MDEPQISDTLLLAGTTRDPRILVLGWWNGGHGGLDRQTSGWNG